MINSDRLVKTFCDIVQIDSVSGEEDEIAADLTTRLETLGLTVEADDYGCVYSRGVVVFFFFIAEN